MLDNEQPPRTQDVVHQEARAALDVLLTTLTREVRQSTIILGIHAKAARPTLKWMRKLETDVTLASRMKNIVLGPILNSGRSWLDNDEIKAFDSRPPQGDEVVTLTDVDFPAVAEWFQALPPALTWATFRREEWISRNISGVFYVVQFADGSEPLIAFTRWNDGMLLRRKGVLAILSDNRYIIEDTTDAVYLPDKIDFFHYQGITFGMNWDALEKSVNFREVTKAKAVGHWATFTAEVPLANSDRVWAMFNKSIRTQNTINKAFSQPRRVPLDMQRVEQFIQQRNLSIRCQNGQLVVDENDRGQLLHLLTILADGYVTSDITDRHLRTFDAEDV